MMIGASAVTLNSDASAAEPAARSWSVSPQSSLFVKVFKDRGTIASGMAHDHVVRASHWQASLDFDPADPASCLLSLVVPVRQLIVDEPSLREQVGFTKPIDAADRNKVRESMLDKDQLDAEHYPTITIEGRHCARASGQVGDFSIDLAVTVRGRTKRLSTNARATSEAGGMRVRGAFKVRHADFGIKPYSAFLGAVANAQPIEFVANIVARR
jgi:polyisoprenoid-binding protein YceI